MAKAKAKSRFVSVLEATILLELPLWTVYRYVKDGTIPSRRLGKHKPVRIERKDIESLLEGKPVTVSHK